MIAAAVMLDGTGLGLQDDRYRSSRSLRLLKNAAPKERETSPPEEGEITGGLYL